MHPPLNIPDAEAAAFAQTLATPEYRQEERDYKWAVHLVLASLLSDRNIGRDDLGDLNVFGAGRHTRSRNGSGATGVVTSAASDTFGCARSNWGGPRCPGHQSTRSECRTSAPVGARHQLCDRRRE